MKLYEVSIYNNLDYGDWSYETKLIVVNSKMEAEIRAESWMKEVYSTGYKEPFYSVEEIKTIDGFNVILERPKNL